MSPCMRYCMLLLLAVVAATLAPAYGRGLQQDAISNSNGCLGIIPKCEQGACATRNVMGTARWVCLRCLANYEPVVDASGQDNILQCVCPRGFFQNGTDATFCTRCEKNQYCPGGDKVENPTNFGNIITCGAGLVTRNTGARSQSDCVAPAGYAMTSPTSATACTNSTYAPMYNRLARCLRCQSGLEESPADNLQASDRASKKTVCKVPPGRYMSQGLVRICPQGFFRANYEAFDAAVAQKCLPCNPGITTDGPGAKSAAECRRVLPGYGIINIPALNSTADIPALPSTDNSTTGLPNATLCALAKYSAGGYCAACPSGTVTRVEGAQSVEECVVPPGYYLSAGSMLKCSSISTGGTFREGWVMYSDPKAQACTACGDNILSEPRDLDENPLAPNDTLVRSTSSSCFIESGQGMIATGKNLFAAKDCPINTYGAAGKVYGWAAAPCKPCPRNMITDGLQKVNNSDVCINDDGFGYQSEGASRCAPGFYAVKGSRRPCRQCPTGRSTDNIPALQRLITDCWVKPGFGVVNSTANSTDAFNPNTDGMSNETLVQLPVLECPIGYYGPGKSVGAECIACAPGSSTEAPGATSADQCTVCIAGYGQGVYPASLTGTCAPCPYGSYSPGGVAQCTKCPDTTFYGPVDGLTPTYTSEGTTLYKGSTGVEQCVPKKSQLSPEAGQAYFSEKTTPTLLSTVALNFSACVESCPVDNCCLAQFEAAVGAVPAVCRLLIGNPVEASDLTPQLVYKLPPSELVGASSVVGKMMSSGYYAHFAPDDADLPKLLTVGSNLGANARTFYNGTAAAVAATLPNKAACQKLCDDSNVCFGFVVVPSATAGQFDCYFRGGVDALNGRAFFALPTNPLLDIGSKGW